MRILEQYVECMKRGDNRGLAELFHDYGVLHDTSLIKMGRDTLHLEGKAEVEDVFQKKFGFNGGPFKIYSVKYHQEDQVWYFIKYGDTVIPVTARLSEVDENQKIRRLNIYPL